MRNVLSIGQLPSLMGGSYTTGMGNVVYELSKCNYSINLVTLGVNCKQSVLEGKIGYTGYTLNFCRLVKNIISHPFKIIKELKSYHKRLPFSALHALFYRLNFEEAINKFQPDIIHLHSIDYAIPLSFCKNISRAQKVLTCHGIFDFENPVRKKYYADVFRCVDYITGLTDEIHDKLLTLGVLESRIKIIPNGVDLSRFRFDNNRRTIMRRQFQIPEDTIVFLTVASVQNRKGQLLFLKDLANLKRDFRYIIVGEGPDIEAIKQFSAENGLSGKIILEGFKSAEELFQYYSAADIYVHASLVEGQSLSEIEAYTCGLKIIVNSPITHTVSTLEQNPDIYRIVSIGCINWNLINDWLTNRYNRVTRNNLGWQTIANQYDSFYKSIL